MSKGTKTLILVGVLVVAGYLGWRWYTNYKASQPGGGPLGTNLNSIAPDLVGGSSGPVAQPAFNVPVNISVTSTAPPPETPDSGDHMIAANPTMSYGGSANPLTTQSDAAAQSTTQMPTDTGLQPVTGAGY